MRTIPTYHKVDLVPITNDFDIFDLVETEKPFGIIKSVW